MGSASREALAKARVALESDIQGSTGPELLQAASALRVSTALTASLGDPYAPAASKSALVDQLFGELSADARRVLNAAVSERWSHPTELVTGVEELGVRAAAIAEPALVDELLAVADTVGGNHELQLNLGSKLISAEHKRDLVARLFASRVTAETLAVSQQLVSGLAGRRVDAELRRAARIAADQLGQELATVTVAAPLTGLQTERLAQSLESSAERLVKITMIIDPDMIGGVHIQIADDVIDGSVRARLEDLRQQLAA